MTHNSRCANAYGHECLCAGCGGSLHGWRGWIDVVDRPKSARDDIRGGVRGKWSSNYKSGKTRTNRGSREAAVDLARLDFVEWIRGSETATVQQVPGSTEVPSADWEWLTRSAPVPSIQVEALGRRVACSTWKVVEEKIDSGVLDGLTWSSEGRAEVKRKVASHVWCDFFLGLAEAVERVQDIYLNEIPAALKEVVRSAVLGSSKKHGLSLPAEVVDTIVDHGWEAFTAVLETHFPLISVVTKPGVLRALRIMAVLCCPAPGEHPEVQAHAVKPLEEDLEGVLLDETKSRLEAAIPGWKEMAGDQ